MEMSAEDVTHCTAEVAKQKFKIAAKSVFAANKMISLEGTFKTFHDSTEVTFDDDDSQYTPVTLDNEYHGQDDPTVMTAANEVCVDNEDRNGNDCNLKASSEALLVADGNDSQITTKPKTNSRTKDKADKIKRTSPKSERDFATPPKPSSRKKNRPTKSDIGSSKGKILAQSDSFRHLTMSYDVLIQGV